MHDVAATKKPTFGIEGEEGSRGTRYPARRSLHRSSIARVF